MIRDILRSVIRKSKNNEEYVKALKDLDADNKIIVYVRDWYNNILKMPLKDITDYPIDRVYDTYLQAFVGRLKERIKKNEI